MRRALAGLGRDELAALAAAGEALARVEDSMRRQGTNPVALLTHSQPAAEFRHFPAGDIYDLASHAQAYYHTHRAGEQGHAHLFLRPKGMPPGIEPAVPVAGDLDAPCHLVAVGFDAGGWAGALFTTNRWVTGEAWYAAADVAALLPAFTLAAPGDLAPVGKWLTALVALFRPLIVHLAAQRDRKVADWSRAHPDFDPLEDEGLEITSRATIDVAAWRALIIPE